MWLDLTDLVFIDPIGTGYSTTGDAGKQYYSVRDDLHSFIPLGCEKSSCSHPR
mgnify:CR=1 FL=1